MPPNLCKRLFSYLSDANSIIFHYPLIICSLKSIADVVQSLYVSSLLLWEQHPSKQNWNSPVVKSSLAVVQGWNQSGL